MFKITPEANVNFLSLYLPSLKKFKIMEIRLKILMNINVNEKPKLKHLIYIKSYRDYIGDLCVIVKNLLIKLDFSNPVFDYY